MSRAEILFCSDFPFGYHNPEAEERMRRFSERGFRVVFVEMIGIRNPGLRHLAEIVRNARGRPGPDPVRAPSPFIEVSPRLLPPRHVPGLSELNARWLERQLRDRLERPAEAIAWVRFPTPELVRAIEILEPRLLVYEQVDDHRSQMDSPRLRRLFDDAEQALLARAGLVFAWSAPIRERLDRLHDNVVLAGPATDIGAFSAAAQRVDPRARHALYMGGIDRRVDGELIAAVSELLPDWTFELRGPDLAGLRPRLTRHANVDVSGPADVKAVPDVVASADVCLLPYRATEFAETLQPIKLIEYLAAGRPVAATPIRAARELADVVETGGSAEEFAAALCRAARDDLPEARRRRQERAAPYEWEARIDQMQGAIERALARTEVVLAPAGD